MKSKKLLLILLTLAMVISLFPASASAVRIQDDTPNITVNTTKVAFAGQTWLVIGDGESGVYPQTDHITLLAAAPVKNSSAVEFREAKRTENEGFTKFEYALKNNPSLTTSYYFADNPEGMKEWEKPYEYAGSTLQQEMERIAKSFSDQERALITGRNLTKEDGIAGQRISDQRLWALSLDEWETIHEGSDDNGVIEWNSDFWWLRTPVVGGNTLTDGVEGYYISSYGADKHISIPDMNYHKARPALSLDLSNVLFTSTANAKAGKSTATVGDGLTDAQTATGRVKFTVVDDSQSLALEVTQGQKVAKVKELKFNYSEATTGENQYVSCVLINKNDVVKYYGKLADSSDAANGKITIPLAGVANGTYTLKIFSEQANGDLYTDFCSEPITYTLTVADGKGTLHVHKWGEPTYTWSEDGTACTASRTCSGDPAHTQKVQATVTGAQTKDPTCTENGETTYTATFKATWASEQTKTVADIDMIAHTLEATPAKEATCTEDGNIAYWTCGTCDKYFSDAEGNTEIKLDDTVIAAKGHNYEDGKCTVCGAEDPDYEAPASFSPEIIAGANSTWQKGTKIGLSFTSNAEFDDFLKVQVDGKDLDASNYTVKEGSTIVTLKAEYLGTLSAGTHTLAIVSETGTAETEFTIKAAPASDDTQSPQTGDNSNMMLWIALLFVSGGALFTMLFINKKKSVNNR